MFSNLVKSKITKLKPALPIKLNEPCRPKYITGEHELGHGSICRCYIGCAHCKSAVGLGLSVRFDRVNVIQHSRHQVLAYKPDNFIQRDLREVKRTSSVK